MTKINFLQDSHLIKPHEGKIKQSSELPAEFKYFVPKGESYDVVIEGYFGPYVAFHFEGGARLGGFRNWYAYGPHINLSEPPSTKYLTSADYKRVASELGVEPEVLMAFTEVESNGKGFLPDGRPVILFERHIFHDLLKDKDKFCPPGSEDICQYNPGGYKGWELEYNRLNRAIQIDEDCALQSASWGLFQIMGFNYSVCGYKNVKSFVEAMKQSEANHLKAVANFLKYNGILPSLRNRDWARVARLYNGEGYRTNRYDEKLAIAYNRLKA